MKIFKSSKRKKLEKEGLASSSRRLKAINTFGHYANRSIILKLFLFVILWGVCSLILTFPYNDNTIEYYLVDGQIAPRTLYSSFNFTYKDDAASEKNKQIARSFAPTILSVDDNASRSILNNTQEVLKKLASAKDNDLDKISKEYNLTSQETLSLCTLGKDANATKTLGTIISSMLKEGIINKDTIQPDNNTQNLCVVDYDNTFNIPRPITSMPDKVDIAKKIAIVFSRSYIGTEREYIYSALFSLLKLTLEPNLNRNDSLTNLEKQIIESSGKYDIKVFVAKGDPIIIKGEKIGHETLEKFKTYEKERIKRTAKTNYWSRYIYNIELSFILVLIVCIYFIYVHKNIIKNNQVLGAVVFVLIASLAALYGSLLLFNYLTAEFIIPTILITCLLPLSIPAILLNSVTGLRGAIFSTLLVSMIATIRTDTYYAIIVGMMFSCFVILALQKAKNYKSFFARSIFVILITLIPTEIIILSESIFNNVQMLLPLVYLCILNAIISGIISLVLLFIIESLFRITTDMSFMNLCDYNHPLLKRLQIEASGTFHHSLLVATLSEQAAREIKANPLKAKACALFHDIGKLNKPEYFIENSQGPNLHDTIKPQMSVIVIKDHVKAGVDLAINYKLGKVIRDSIEQHHGTDIVRYFYKKAQDSQNQECSCSVDEQDFRYPGPKVKDREISIVALADICEATSRSIEKPTPIKIGSMVNNAINNKINSGQLDVSELSLADLATIKSSFAKSLVYMRHARISYGEE